MGSTTHLVLIPSYNPGPKVYETVRAALAQWAPVWVVVDGSTDGSGEGLLALTGSEPNLRVLILPHNQGKGAAVLHGIREAMLEGFTHALTMDSDGQHPTEQIQAFMQVSRTHPASMVLGSPVFDSSAPSLRVKGRKISNWWANLETLWAGIGDSLYGFRVYPIAALERVMRYHPWMRRFDFDVEAVVRLSWRGIFHRRRRRRLPFQLLARQCVVDVDAHPALLRVSREIAVVARQATAPLCVTAAGKSGLRPQYSENTPKHTVRSTSTNPASRMASIMTPGAAQASIVSQ
jgi:glycosyltransferase involved in cell wall biosynthesis